MISCTQCKNAGYCTGWKSIQIDIRCEIEFAVPLCHGGLRRITQRIKRGLVAAKNCKKFQEIVYSGGSDNGR